MRRSNDEGLLTLVPCTWCIEAGVYFLRFSKWGFKKIRNHVEFYVKFVWHTTKTGFFSKKLKLTAFKISNRLKSDLHYSTEQRGKNWNEEWRPHAICNELMKIPKALQKCKRFHKNHRRRRSLGKSGQDIFKVYTNDPFPSKESVPCAMMASSFMDASARFGSMVSHDTFISCLGK